MSNVRIEDQAEGFVAKVDSEGCLFTRPQCAPHAVTTTLGAYGSTGVAVVAPALSGCCSAVIQNQGSVPLGIEFDADPGAGSFQIAAGQSWVVPFAFAGEIRGQGVGGSGTFATLQARHAS